MVSHKQLTPPSSLLSVEEIHLREVMDRSHWSLVAFAVHTGLRQAEQFRLRWDLES